MRTSAGSSRGRGTETSSRRTASQPTSSSPASRATRPHGTLRGLHFQSAPHEETKLVRCTRGAIYDVIVDLRPGSATHTRWVGVELDADRATALYVPKGFAHGFQTLVDETEVLYLMSEPYVAEASTGVRWDDPAFAIAWPEADSRTMSDRDREWADYDPGSLRTRGT